MPLNEFQRERATLRAIVDLASGRPAAVPPLLERAIVARGGAGVIPEVVTGSVSRAADLSTMYPQKGSA